MRCLVLSSARISRHPRALSAATTAQPQQLISQLFYLVCWTLEIYFSFRFVSFRLSTNCSSGNDPTSSESDPILPLVSWCLTGERELHIVTAQPVSCFTTFDQV